VSEAYGVPTATTPVRTNRRLDQAGNAWSICSTPERIPVGECASSEAVVGVGGSDGHPSSAEGPEARLKSVDSVSAADSARGSQEDEERRRELPMLRFPGRTYWACPSPPNVRSCLCLFRFGAPSRSSGLAILNSLSGPRGHMTSSRVDHGNRPTSPRQRPCRAHMAIPVPG